MLRVASKSFVHVNIHAQNMHKSYMHNSPLSATGHKRGSNNDAGIIREQIMVLLYISVSSYWS